jgi:hypothetical protein
MHSTQPVYRSNKVRFLYSMKAFALLLLAAASFALSGCETDMPPDAHRENPIQRGIRGDGTVTERDFSNDPYVREESRQSY